MKKYIAILSMTGLMFASVAAIGQNNNETLVLEEVNGVKELTVTTTVDGKTNTTVLRGKDAQAKLDALKKQGNEIILNEFIADDGRKLFNVKVKKVNTSTK